MEHGEETIRMILPEAGNGPFVEGALNGVNFRIPTDKLVEVPRRIAKVIAESRRGIPEGSRAVEAFTEVGGRKIG